MSVFENNNGGPIGVTAASGRLGRVILAALHESAGQRPIVALARDPSRLERSGVEARAGDYNDAESMVRACTGLDTVVLISAPTAVGTDRLRMHANAIGAARRAGVRKIVYTSIIGDEISPDALFYPSQRLNRETERLLRESGPDWVIARNGLYLDLDIRAMRAAADDGVYRTNAANGRCGYISIDELGFALAQLALRDHCNGEIVNLTGEPVTQAQLVALANEAFGMRVRYQPITAGQCVEKFMAIPSYAERGIEVARMLTGCFECIAAGTFDVRSDFERAAGRPPKSTRSQIQALVA